jgi:hypothetical protein
VYHGDPLGTGADGSGVTFSPPNHAWTSPVLDGQVYGEPLEATGRVYVATENDTIYALAANTGAVLWFKHVGTPVPSSLLPCGDISPTVGITGTPVLDVGRGAIYAVADEDVGGAPQHFLVGLNLYNGNSLLPPERVDPPGGQDPAAILQRTGLNLSDGNVVFGYGGNDGDCSTYSGWVVAAPENGGTPGYYQRLTPRATSGWQPATARRRTPTTTATPCSSSLPAWRARSSSLRQPGCLTTRATWTSARARQRCYRTGPPFR